MKMKYIHCKMQYILDILQTMVYNTGEKEGYPYEKQKNENRPHGT